MLDKESYTLKYHAYILCQNYYTKVLSKHPLVKHCTMSTTRTPERRSKDSVRLLMLKCERARLVAEESLNAVHAALRAGIAAKAMGKAVDEEWLAQVRSEAMRAMDEERLAQVQLDAMSNAYGAVQEHSSAKKAFS